MPKSTTFAFPSLTYNIALYVGVLSNLFYSVSFPGWILASLALTWLFFRFNQVLRTPVDDLVRVLGLEVPRSPEPSIIDIKSDGIYLRWEPLETKNSVVKYAVQVNGILVAEIPAQDTSIRVTGLPAGRCYSIRIVAVNSANFHAPSDAIRFRTLDDKDRDSESSSSESDNEDDNWDTAPVVLPFKDFREATSPPAIAPSMARENSGSLTSPRRGPSTLSLPSTTQVRSENKSEDWSQDADTAISVQELNEKHDQLRREIQDVEQQEKTDLEKFEEQQKEQITRREELREQVQKRETEMRDIKKDNSALEKENATAQKNRLNQEKALQTKRKEREKNQEDTKRMEQELVDMQEEAASLANLKEEIIQSAQDNIRKIKTQQEGDVQKIRDLEDQCKNTGNQVKELDEQRKAYEENFHERDSPQGQHFEAQADAEWGIRLNELQQRYKAVWLECERANHYRRQLQERWETLGGRPVEFVNPNRSLDNLHVTSEMQHIAQNALRMRTGSSPNAYGFNSDKRLSHSSSLHARRPPNLNTTNLRTSMPYFNSLNISTERANVPFSQAELESISGSALASPSAGALLPSDLLDNDQEEASAPAPSTDRPEFNEIHESRSSSGANSAMRMRHRTNPSDSSGLLPGLGMVPGQDSQEFVNTTLGGPTSPASVDSRSPSIQSSSRGSITGSHRQRLSEGFLDSDRRSTKSANVIPKARHSMFGSVFGRQRGKTMPDEGPALGSLTSLQSHSMPHNLDQSDINPEGGTDENRRLQGMSLLGSVSNAMLGRRVSSNRVPDDDPVSNRGSHFNILNMRANPWTRSSIKQSDLSRPSSVYSTDLPHPLAEQQPFGWNEGGISRASSTRMSQHNVYPWSINSRRGSIKVDSSTHLSGIEQLGEDDNDLLPDRPSSTQAPIGTKPIQTSKNDSKTSQLNPAARDFRSMFSREKKLDKGETRDKKNADKAERKSKGKDRANDGLGITGDQDSPELQKPKDASLSRIASAEDLSVTESTPSTPLEGTPTPSSANRESFVRKMQRKGSSSKFSLSSLKSRKPTTSSSILGEDAADEDSGSASLLGKSVDSVTSSPQIGGPGPDSKRSSAFSLSSFKKRSKKGADAPSISEASTSEAGDETGELSGRTSADD